MLILTIALMFLTEGKCGKSRFSVIPSVKFVKFDKSVKCRMHAKLRKHCLFFVLENSDNKILKMLPYFYMGVMGDSNYILLKVPPHIKQDNHFFICTILQARLVA